MDGIDFVVTWVDGNDPAWRKEKAGYAPANEVGDRKERYRDWGILKYWFRGVEQFAPWVRRVHFVTWGHIPAWMNTECERLHIVRHEDYIPERFLPVFNSTVLEIYMHRIEGLSEHFVYFNDDMHLIGATKPEEFFVDGRPCDMLAFQPIVANPKNPVMPYQYLNNLSVLARHFDKRENVKKQPGNYFKIGYPPLYFFYNLLELAFPQYTGFYTVHGPAPFCKSTFFELWEKEPEVFEKMSANRFRSDTDVTPYLFRTWQMLSGNFVAKNLHRDFRYFELEEKNTELFATIRGQKKKIICINDAGGAKDFARVRRGLIRSFERILPEKSEFER